MKIPFANKKFHSNHSLINIQIIRIVNRLGPTSYTEYTYTYTYTYEKHRDFDGLNGAFQAWYLKIANSQPENGLKWKAKVFHEFKHFLFGKCESAQDKRIKAKEAKVSLATRFWSIRYTLLLRWFNRIVRWIAGSFNDFHWRGRFGEYDVCAQFDQLVERRRGSRRGSRTAFNGTKNIGTLIAAESLFWRKKM